ncbi:MAG TPA: gluconate 2-dehydrogenase subunit 3 family protein [Longimicrobiaceae bacterium]|nr:gluconate 2-dehydrogenase subunit 3 family protein [Longimicrobiaceae bacterium]
MNRREAITLLALAPLGGAMAGHRPAPLPPTAPEARPAPEGPLFFTPAELATVSVLADLVIPVDGRSGSATDAKVPEFMDYMLHDSDSERWQVEMRGGLAWLDRESRKRYGKDFIGLAEPQQTAILDDIAWPEKARPEMSPGVAFFNRFRDLVASGFWSSRMGVDDLQYRGNTVVLEWKGCPPEALAKLGVSYDD